MRRYSRPKIREFFLALDAARAGDWSQACRRFAAWREIGLGPLHLDRQHWGLAAQLGGEFERQRATDALDSAPVPGDPWEWEARFGDVWLEFLVDLETALTGGNGADAADFAALHAIFRAAFFRSAEAAPLVPIAVFDAATHAPPIPAPSRPQRPARAPLPSVRARAGKSAAPTQQRTLW